MKLKLLNHVGTIGSLLGVLLPGLVFVATLSASCTRQPQTGAAANQTPQAAASPIPWATIEPPTHVSTGTSNAQPKRLPIRTFRGTGVIRFINLKEGWFEIDHEEIAGHMAAMRMQWRVKRGSMLKSVSVGDKVVFKLQDDNGSEVIIELKRAESFD